MPCSQGLPRPARNDPGEECTSLLPCKFGDLPMRNRQIWLFGAHLAMSQHLSERGREGGRDEERRGCFPLSGRDEANGVPGGLYRNVIPHGTRRAEQRKSLPACSVPDSSHRSPKPVHPLFFFFFFFCEISFFCYRFRLLKYYCRVSQN